MDETTPENDMPTQAEESAAEAAAAPGEAGEEAALSQPAAAAAESDAAQPAAPSDTEPAAPVQEPIQEAAPAGDTVTQSVPTGLEPAAGVDADRNQEILTSFVEIGQGTIQLMGLSFILGSLFTILILILLDFMRRNQNQKK